MKSNVEKLIIGKASPKGNTNRNSSNCSKSKLLFPIAIIIVVSQFIIYLFLIIKLKNEMLLNYQLKDQIASINTSLQLYNNKVWEQNNQIETTNKELNKLLEEKESLQASLNRRKERSLKLAKEIKDKKRYQHLSQSLSVMLSPRYIETTEIMTRCTFIETCYRLSRDGYSAKAFHNKCAGLRPTAVIITDSTDLLFGGFTNESWEGNELKYDSEAFLFSLQYMNRFEIIDKKPAINASPDLLPTFGKDDIFIDEKSAYIREPLISYRSYVSDTKLDYFKVKEIEVYHMECEEKESK